MGNFVTIRKTSNTKKHYHAYREQNSLMKLYVDSIPNKFLTKKEQLFYGKMFREGNDDDKIKALHCLVESSLFLVLRIVKDNYYTGFDIQDLVQEGNIGLIKAVEKYDYRKGFAFTTYACWWVKQSMSKAVKDKAFGMRIPVHVYEFERLVNATKKQLLIKGLEPTDELLAEQLGKNPRYLQKHAINFNMRHFASLDNMATNQGDNLLAFILNLGDPRSDIVNNLSQTEIKKFIRVLLRTVIKTEKEKHILCLRYGLCSEIELEALAKYKQILTNESVEIAESSDKKSVIDFFKHPLTREIISELVGLTCERVRQLEYRALKQLREFRLRNQELFIDLY